MRRIEDFQLFCASNDLTLLIDSDMILQQPVKLMEIDQNLICLNLLRVSINAISYQPRNIKFNLIYFLNDLHYVCLHLFFAVVTSAFVLARK